MPRGTAARKVKAAGKPTGSNLEVDAIIDALSDERGPLLEKLRQLIHAADPEIIEVVKWKKPSSPLGAAVFEHEGIVCILVPLKDRVRLSFPEGAALPDPHGLFNAQLNGVSRAIDVPVGARLDEAAVKVLIRSAVDQRRKRSSGKAKTSMGSAPRATRH